MKDNVLRFMSKSGIYLACLVSDANARPPPSFTLCHIVCFLVLVELLGESCGELVSLLNYKKHNSLLHFNHGCIWVSRSFILNITF